MEKRLLDCGHRQSVEPGRSLAWCAIDNATALVVDEPTAPRPSAPRPPVAQPGARGTAAALALTARR